MKIERKHFAISGAIIALAFMLQPFSLIFSQMYIAPAMYEKLVKMNEVSYDDLYVEMGIDSEVLSRCIADPSILNKITSEQKLGETLGVNGTPGTFVGFNDGNGNIVLKGELINGALPLDSVKGSIEAAKKASASKNTFKVSDLTIYGNPNAEIVLVEFSDLECPFCQRFHPTVKQIVDSSDGKIALAFKHFPLSFHPKAIPFATNAECIKAQTGNEGFFKYVDAIFEGKVK